MRIIQAEPFLLVQCLNISVLVEIFGVGVVNIENHVLSVLLVCRLYSSKCFVSCLHLYDFLS